MPGPRVAALARERGAAAAHRRHDKLVAAAGARVDVGASTEPQVLAEANAHLAQAPAAAGHRDAVAAEARIGLYERLLDLVGRDRERRARRDIGIGDLHRRARLANVLEIGVRAQPRAGAVAVPLVEDQARRGHQIEHGGDDVAVEPRRWLLAEFREAPLVLRPQPVHDEGIGPRAALLLRRRASLAGGFAERRRPREREDVEVELSGLILAAILRRRDIGDSNREPHRHRGQRHATDAPDHRTLPSTHARTWATMAP